MKPILTINLKMQILNQMLANRLKKLIIFHKIKILQMIISWEMMIAQWIKIGEKNSEKLKLEYIWKKILHIKK